MVAREKTTTVVVEHGVLNKVLIGCVLAAVISWIVFVAKANSHDVLGDNVHDITAPTAEQQQGMANIATADVCFQAAIAVAALYYVINHHMDRY